MRATEFIVETAMMGKIADSGKIIRILKKAHTVSFSDEKNWLLVDTDPGKGNSRLGIKWIPADTRFEWVRPFHDNINESNVFTDARMNAIKAGKKVFKVHGKTYNVTGDITDELEASVNENLSPQTIHKLADRKGVKWDNEPSFLALTKRLTGKEHLDDLDQAGLNKVKRHLDGLQGVAEGKEEYNRELHQKGFRFEQEINGVTYRVSNVKGGSDNIKIHALDKKQKVIGSASFWRHQYQDGLESLSTHVDPAWQGKGIATNMYAVMRMLGVNIHPATMQSDDGKKMWDKWRKNGDAKHIKSMNAKMTGVAEGIEPDYMAGHCHVMALALKKLHPDWKIRAHIGWDEDAEEDSDYRIDHVYIVALDGTAYDCRGKFSSEEELVGPDETGGVETQFVDYGIDDIKHDIARGELKRFGKEDLVQAVKFIQSKQGVAENFADGKNPQDKGDAKRHGVPTKASVSTLRKVAKQGGRKGQLAHWMANMKAGRAKKKTNEAEVATKNSDEIWQQLRAAGYQYVGSGADATVFAKDDSHVIKILMPEDMGTKAEQVFRKFYEFSMSHQDLACVPRFNEVNTIDINGKDYTQIEMERLSPIEKNSFIEGLIWFLSDYINTNTPWPTVESELVNPETWEIYSPNYANAFAKTWQSLLENPASKKTYAMYRQLYNVMKLLYTTGTINKFGWDLHTSNVMLRQNGQPVIIDPWFSEGTS